MLLSLGIRRHCCRDLLAEQQQRSVAYGWFAAGIGLLCAAVIWLITAKLFPVIHDVATLTSSEDEEERVPDTDCKTRRGGTDRQNG